MGFIAIGLIFCVGLHIAQGCSSSPMHPEMLYCTADFVIKIFVKSQKQVYVQEDGTFVDANTPEKNPPIIPEHEDGDSDPSPWEPEEIPPDLFPPEPIISNEGGAGVALGNQGHILSSESNDASNEQPEENEEAGPAPEGGRVINWHGIRTGHSVSPDGAEDSATDQGSHKEAAARRGRYVAMKFAAAHRTNYAQLGPDGATPGNIDHFAGIEGRQRSSRRKRSRNLKRRSSKRTQRRHSHPRFSRDAGLGGLLVPDAPVRGSSPHTGVLMQQYSITLLKVLKGNVHNDTQYLYTPPHGGLCIMNLKLKHPYIVMGSFRNHQLFLHQADYNIDVSQLSADELRHLTSNMKHRYSKGCKDCFIKICNPRCNDKPGADQCLWKNPYTLMDVRASQFACVRKKKGLCGWYNALKPNMTQEHLD